ncbi:MULTISPECIES: TA system toxin CbtA family protein [Enterobacteriaceae]|uniref:TA system toxin CbtA family protein n=1 Tax=Enterobacteriaceae TaxID=543 RepID=UPI000D73126F|nr:MULTISPECIES: TA system toxin CbtA family protein [Enterobacteriaceae]PWY10839.1 toxin CbtA [Citrobacter koseri]VUT19009.1 Cytoskeleton-binding toxin CbtA [Klebsiella pasteurii]
MQTKSSSLMRAASSRPSPVDVWQALLTSLLAQHYSLTLSDTPFSDEQVILQYIEAGISLADALNFIVEKYELLRTDRPGFSILTQSPFITPIDVLRARKATGLMNRGTYKEVTAITRGQHTQARTSGKR